MRETFSEWECMPGSAPGLIESMDAAGFDVGVHAQHGDGESTTTTAQAEASEARTLPSVRTMTCLDLRHLPAPQPLEQAMAAADALAPGTKLEVWTPMLPMPLLQLLDARGFMACAELRKDGTARIFIGRGND